VGPIIEAAPFSIFNELTRTIGYTIPAFALIWYLVFDKKSVVTVRNPFIPGKRDILPYFFALPALIVIGLCISFLINRFNQFGTPIKISAPANWQGWTAMGFGCLCTGYLEESYFRFYLLNKLKEFFRVSWVRILFSTVLFSLCHIYEGPWGVINAALAGIILGELYEKTESLNGIALAHGSYNAFVYIMAYFSV
jgi:membrane protease YdiL (CAAX protease family)